MRIRSLMVAVAVALVVIAFYTRAPQGEVIVHDAPHVSEAPKPDAPAATAQTPSEDASSDVSSERRLRLVVTLSEHLPGARILRARIDGPGLEAAVFEWESGHGRSLTTQEPLAEINYDDRIQDTRVSRFTASVMVRDAQGLTLGPAFAQVELDNELFEIDSKLMRVLKDDTFRLTGEWTTVERDRLSVFGRHFSEADTLKFQTRMNEFIASGALKMAIAPPEVDSERLERSRASWDAIEAQR